MDLECTRPKIINLCKTNINSFYLTHLVIGRCHLASRVERLFANNFLTTVNFNNASYFNTT